MVAASDQVAVELEKVSIHGTTSEPMLQDISLRVPKGSLAIVSGPVGSGKSVLAKVILGEMQPTQGTARVSSRRIGFCQQHAWLPAGTIQDAVCSGDDNIDQVLYSAVVAACCLDYDIERLEEGDLTVIGSRGANLSGGQRHRVVRPNS